MLPVPASSFETLDPSTGATTASVSEALPFDPATVAINHTFYVSKAGNPGGQLIAYAPT